MNFSIFAVRLDEGVEYWDESDDLFDIWRAKSGRVLKPFLLIRGIAKPVEAKRADVAAGSESPLVWHAWRYYFLWNLGMTGTE
jgi:hypothetical protein